MKEIHITIYPPFWTTWWFITLIALLLMTALAYGINSYNKRKYRKKLMELESEHKLQMERERISRDLHDSIGAYANAVLYSTELLEKENVPGERSVLMSDLKFASKDIITSLRETIWALKKDNYTAEDCLLRIKNFVQSLSRYYTKIQFSVTGDAPPVMNLHYTKALNLVRIVQEAVTNSLKHAEPKHISITSIEWEGKWELVVADDGKGFDHEGAQETEQGNGLSNMKQRAIDSELGFTLSSETGNGTRVCIIV